MNIFIKYESCWQNSILENKTISPKSSVRKFNKSKKNGNLQPISKNTVMGVLYRLTGDQRTLQQIRQSDKSYFSDIEEQIDFSLQDPSSYEELVMIINKSNDRCGDGNYIGVIKDDVRLFFSAAAPKLWTVLYLSIDEIISFIKNPKLIATNGSSMPRDILDRIDEIQGFEPLSSMQQIIDKKLFAKKKQQEYLKKLDDNSKSIDGKTQKKIVRIEATIQKIDDEIKKTKQDNVIIERSLMMENILLKLKNQFPTIPEGDYLKKGVIYPMGLYAAALYLQADLLDKSGENMSEIYTLQEKGKNKGVKTIQGFSKKGFNGVRDFLNKLSTGGEKKTVKTPFTITKSNGLLDIELNVSKNRAEEIESMVNNASVSSFYLGKKGLAYVDNISVKEVLT